MRSTVDPALRDAESSTVKRLSIGRVAVAAIAAFAIAVPAAVASHGYWDYHADLCSGCSYGEGQSGTSGYWNIRVSQNTTAVQAWLRRRDNSNWEWASGGAQDYTVNYPLSVYNASRATNGGCCTYFVNVRIDGSV